MPGTVPKPLVTVPSVTLSARPPTVRTPIASVPLDPVTNLGPIPLDPLAGRVPTASARAGQVPHARGFVLDDLHEVMEDCVAENLTGSGPSFIVIYRIRPRWSVRVPVCPRFRRPVPSPEPRTRRAVTASPGYRTFDGATPVPDRPPPPPARTRSQLPLRLSLSADSRGSRTRSRSSLRRPS